MGMSSLTGVLKHVISSIKYYTIAVASGEGAQVATDLWALSIGKAKGVLAGLAKVLFSWQALAVAAVATLGIAASTTTDWSNIVSGLSVGFKELISTLWVGLEPLIVSIQNAREAFGGWLGDVTGMESRMILIRTMQEIGAFLGTFVQLGAKLLGFFVDIGVEIGKWFAGSLGPGSHFESFVQFWKDWVNPEVDIDWSNALSKSIEFFVDLAGMLVSAMVQAWDFVVTVVKDMAIAGVDYATHGGAGTNTVTINGQDYAYNIVAGVGSFTAVQGGGEVGTAYYGEMGPAYMDNSIWEAQQAANRPGKTVNVNAPGGDATWTDAFRDGLVYGLNLLPFMEAEGSSGANYGTPGGDQAVLAASGGPISAYGRMAAGGGMNRGGPLLVGELGPEIFIPSTSGRIVSNKDLNTRRTRSMLNDWRDRGATNGGGGASVMTVGTIVSANSVSKNSKISIDSYAGVV